MIKSPAFYFYIGLITISVIFVTQALRIPVYDEFLSSGRFLPLVLSFFMVLFSCILAYQQFQSSEGTTHKIEHRFHFFGFLFLVVAYVILIPVFPFSLVTFFFLLASFIFFRTLSFWKRILLAVILVVVIVFIFQTIFQIVFP